MRSKAQLAATNPTRIGQTAHRGMGREELNRGVTSSGTTPSYVPHPGYTTARSRPEIRFRGCMYYEHANFGGKRTSIPGGIRRRLARNGTTRFSSIACNPYCKLTVYEYRDFNAEDFALAAQE